MIKKSKDCSVAFVGVAGKMLHRIYTRAMLNLPCHVLQVNRTRLYR